MRDKHSDNYLYLIEKHTISNVDEGGLNVADNKELRKEVSALLDNGILGLKMEK